jgi:hypothetical protein
MSMVIETGLKLAARVRLGERVNFGPGAVGIVKAYRIVASRQVLTVRPEDGGQVFAAAVEIEGQREEPGFVIAGPIDRDGAVTLARRVLAGQSERTPVTQAVNDLAAAVIHLNDIIEGNHDDTEEGGAVAGSG